MKNEFVIGVLGGMGTYATIHLFQQYAEMFSAEKEWDRPRLLIDNRCTMPSRVRAFLYHENVDRLVEEMTESLSGLSQAGCTRIILACNTSHLFLPQIYQLVPALKSKIINIIDICVRTVASDGKTTVTLLGSEGTIDSRIYQEALEKAGVTCAVPSKAEYSLLRDCIEAVKQNKYTESVREEFLGLVNQSDSCILGCTELPILYKKYQADVRCRSLYDPLLLGLLELKKEYDNE